MFKDKSKSILTLLLVSIVCFSLIGCTSKDASVKSDSTAGQKVTTEKSANWSVVRPEGVPKDFPNDDIEWIYAFGPGSPMDAYVRILGDKIKNNEGWDHGIIVTYKEGASGRIGWNKFAESKPDGYTLGFAPSAMLISSVSEEVSYGADKMSYIFNCMSDPGAIGVGIDSPYKTLKDLIDAAKANPGKVTMGVTSTIGQEGLTLKMIQKVAGVEFNIVAFDGEAEIFTAIMGNHLDGFCLNVCDCTTFIEDKQVVVLATGDSERSEFLPEVLTYKEEGYDVQQVNMRGIAAPKGMEEPIRQYLENCFIAAANDPEIQAKAAEMKLPIDSLTGAEMHTVFTKLTENYVKLYEEDPWR